MRPRLDGLTGLRFCAAAVVVAYHLVEVFHRAGPLVRLTGPGFVGVEFFFVLSGLVLAWSYDGASVRTFYRRRFARVWPLHAATLVTVVVLFGSAGTRSFAQNASLTQVWTARPAVYFSYNSPSWSLGCEALFYALFPLLLPLFLRSASPRRLAILIVAVAAGLGGCVYITADDPTAYWFLYIFPGYRVFEFMLGMVIGIALQRGDRAKVSISAAAALVLLGLALAAVVSPIRPTSYDRAHYWLYDMLALPGIALLLFAVASANLDRELFLGRLPMRTLGEWSFALYMTHQIVMRVVAQSPLSSSIALKAAVASALLLPVAGVAHVGLERPIERLLRGSRQRRPAPRRPEAEGLISPRLPSDRPHRDLPLG